jgi:hypothetical protein
MTFCGLMAVAVGQSAQQLTGPGQHMGFWQRPFPLDPFGHALPLDEVHDQVGVAAFFEKVGHPHQVRMAEPGQDLRLSLELLAQFGQGAGIQATLGRHLLEGDGDI